ncbi:hypothetical protein EJ08DRAFT_263044 [Tothia fuscella]|uniref:Uncharacterized protein n=1 Tax=Tothia fuscella TaxID=1048955 RepID=A0A9P4NRD4_9PEZI|nr:hypothetical protein EJ08DRAFT_263044 [Tothia fuscella]
MTTQIATGFRFFDLLGEIRNRIYNFHIQTIQSQTVDVIYHKTWTKVRLEDITKLTNPLVVSCQYNYEARDILFKHFLPHSDTRFRNIEELTFFMRTVGFKYPQLRGYFTCRIERTEYSRQFLQQAVHLVQKNARDLESLESNGMQPVKTSLFTIKLGDNQGHSLRAKWNRLSDHRSATTILYSKRALFHISGHLGAFSCTKKLIDQPGWPPLHNDQPILTDVPEL